MPVKFAAVKVVAPTVKLLLREAEAPVNDNPDVVTFTVFVPFTARFSPPGSVTEP